MSDDNIRELERDWRASPTEETADRFLNVRLRGYDLPIRRLIETAIRSERFLSFGFGAESRVITSSNVVEYLLGLPVSPGELSYDEVRLQQSAAELDETVARLRNGNGG